MRLYRIMSPNFFITNRPISIAIQLGARLQVSILEVRLLSEHLKLNSKELNVTRTMALLCIMTSE